LLAIDIFRWRHTDGGKSGWTEDECKEERGPTEELNNIAYLCGIKEYPKYLINYRVSMAIVASLRARTRIGGDDAKMVQLQTELEAQTFNEGDETHS
jgi:hypothetical protein